MSALTPTAGTQRVCHGSQGYYLLRHLTESATLATLTKCLSLTLFTACPSRTRTFAAKT